MFFIRSVKNIFDKDTVAHLRLPFSIFLLPVFMFGLSQAYHPALYKTFLVFIILHFFIYPASNAYNSYMDQDQGSIGGLKNPPPATKKLYFASLLLDLAGMCAALLINSYAPILFGIYSLVSRAYSWHGIRLKKHAIISWVVVSTFQGSYTFFIASFLTSNNIFSEWLTLPNTFCLIISFFLVGGVYPLTQVFQHKEDEERKDRTISLVLGIKKTFNFSAICFLIAFLLQGYYFYKFNEFSHYMVLIIALLPVITYFIWWMIKCYKNPTFASYKYAMRFHYIASPAMIIAYSVLLLMNC